MPTFFDSHCHFDFAAFDQDREELWQQCQSAGLTQLLIPGTEPEQWQKAEMLSQYYKGILIAAGIHPWCVNQVAQLSADLYDLWRKQLQHSACVAIGECGLDAMIDTPMDQQIVFFEAHLQLACEHDIPLIIHVRKSHNDTLRLLQQYKPSAGGVIHGFSGSKELAEQYWRLGFYLGIGGTITYPRANKTREAVKHLPLEALLLETDAPDMPLIGHQGERNSPLRIVDIAASLAELRGETLERIALTTTSNSQTLFRL